MAGSGPSDGFACGGWATLGDWVAREDRGVGVPVSSVDASISVEGSVSEVLDWWNSTFDDRGKAGSLTTRTGGGDDWARGEALFCCWDGAGADAGAGAGAGEGTGTGDADDLSFDREAMSDCAAERTSGILTGLLSAAEAAASRLVDGGAGLEDERPRTVFSRADSRRDRRPTSAGDREFVFAIFPPNIDWLCEKVEDAGSLSTDIGTNEPRSDPGDFGLSCSSRCSALRLFHASRSERAAAT